MYLTWFEGNWSEGNVPLFGAMDHSVWLGSSVFDGARAVRGHLPDLEPHLERAVRSAERLGMRCPLTVAQMDALVREGVARFPADAELYIRPLVFARAGFLVPDPEHSGFALTLFDAPLPPFSGFSACLAPLRRPDPRTAPTDAKASALYPNTARVLRAAQERGFDNAVVLDLDGNVAEFATSNLFLVTADGEAVTPAPNGSFLAGITRARVLALLRADGATVSERAVRPEELLTAREIFNTGNYGKVTPCIRYEERALPVGPLAQQARARYWAFMEQQ
jgi:branched-chain amino acid aminotransferase